MKNLKKAIVPGNVEVANLGSIPPAEEVIISEGVKEFYIGIKGSYTGASPLKRIKKLVAPSSVEKFSVSTLSIEEFTIPQNVTELINSCFNKCYKLKELEIPSSVKHIGTYVFTGCSSLSRLVVPSSVTSADGFAFAYTYQNNQWGDKDLNGDGLIEIEIQNGAALNNSESQLAYNNKLKKATIGPGLKKVPNGLFRECESLEEVIFSDGSTIEKIENNAFYGCKSLKRFVVPSGCKTIAASAFDMHNDTDSQLKYLYLPSGITNIGYTAFRFFNNGVTIDCGFAEGVVANAPWGATNATINYNVPAPSAEE